MILCYNGRFGEPGELGGLPPLNRAFLFGDGFFETIRTWEGKVLNRELHARRMRYTAEQLGLEFRDDDWVDKIMEDLLRLMQLERLSGGRGRVNLFRGGGGLYEPVTDRCEYLIGVSALDAPPYPEHTGLRVAVAEGVRLPLGALQSLKTTGRSYQVMAARERSRRHLDELVLLNTEGLISEAISSNVFLYREGALYLPSEGQGQVEGIMQERVAEMAAAKGYPVIRAELGLQDLGEAEEVFLTNAIHGIRPVNELDGRARDMRVARELQQALRRSV